MDIPQRKLAEMPEDRAKDFLGQPKFSGKGFTILPEPTEPLDIDSPIFDQMKDPYTVRNFLVPRRPLVFEEIDDKDAFTYGTSVNTLDMPIKLAGQKEVRVPVELEADREAIQKWVNFAASNLPDWVDRIFYITTDRRRIRRGSSQRRPGIHTDGFQGARYQKKNPPDIVALVHDHVPFVSYAQSFDFTGLNTGKHDFHAEMSRQADESNAVPSENYKMYVFDAFTGHRAGEAEEDIERNLVRFNASYATYDFIGNTHNPLLDYDWEMVDRTIPNNLIKESIVDSESKRRTQLEQIIAKNRYVPNIDRRLQLIDFIKK